MSTVVERIPKFLIAVLVRAVSRSRKSGDPANLSPPRILVVRQHDQLGDMLCVVPLLRALRARYPRAPIILVASPVNASVMLHNRFVDEVILYDKRQLLGRAWLRPVALLHFILGLRRRTCDLAVVPATVSFSFTSDFLAFLSGATTRIGAGSIDGRENPWSPLATHPVSLDWIGEPHRHQTLRNLDIGSPLGIAAGDLTLEMTLTPEERDWGKQFVIGALGANPFGVGFHPGAGKPGNRWPAERFADLADRIAEKFGAAILITSGPKDADPVREMRSRMKAPAHLLEQQQIRRVASVLSRLRLYITNDTGVMHVAAAAGARVLSLFGTTDPGQWAPPGPGNRYIQGRDGSMESITVEEVFDAAAGMLESPPAGLEQRAAISR